MALTTEQRQELAGRLQQAQDLRAPLPPLAEVAPGFELDDAYAVQLATVAARTRAGATVRGHKVGLTAKAMQDLLGVDEPDYGHIFDDMVFSDGARLSVADYCQPRVEPEITFLLREPLRGPGVTVSDVLAATEAVIPSLEIVDSRIADWKITLADTIADNASSAATVLGSAVAITDAPPLPEVAVDLLVDGEVVSSGTGADVLGDPAVAVAWLANTLAEHGTELGAGHLVMPGSCTSAPFATAGQHVEARFAGLGNVSAEFTP